MTHLPGLSFDLSETIESLRDIVRAFAADEIAPRAAAIDHDNLFPADLWKKLGELGLHGMTVSEEYGGSNLGYLAHMVGWRRCRAPLRRSVCRTARIRTCA